MAVTSIVVSVEAAEPIVRFFAHTVAEQQWEPGNQLYAYNEHSIYFALNHEGLIVGGLQLVRGNDAGCLPVRSVWPELPLAGRKDVADIALLAVSSSFRGKEDTYWDLCVAMWRWCVENGIIELWAEVTPRNLRLYQRLGWPFDIAGPLRPHWGEGCYPCRLSVHEVYKIINARAEGNSPRYRRILADALEGNEAPVTSENAK